MKVIVVFIVAGLLFFSCSPPEEIKNAAYYDDYKISVSVRNSEDAISATQSVCLRYTTFVEKRGVGNGDDLVKLEFVVHKVGDAGLKQIREDFAWVPHVISISIYKVI